MTHLHLGHRRVATVGLATAVLTSVFTALPAQANPVAVAPAAVITADTCTAAPDKTISVFSFNDFHGRIDTAAALFTPVEQARAAQGADNVLLLSDGDNIGGSTFESASQDDDPTLDILKLAKVEAAATGNHEFDQGWSDLKDDVIPTVQDTFPYLAANVYTTGTTTVPAPLKAHQIFTKNGVRIAVIGAVTGDLPSLVSPAGISGLTIGNPIEAVNREAAAIKAAGTADVVVASIHDGGTDDATAKTLMGQLSGDVDVVFNGHTHATYDTTTAKNQPVMQAASYGTKLAQMDLAWSSTEKKLCTVTTTTHSVNKANADTSLPAIAAINTAYTNAKAQADVVGSKVIGEACKAVTRGLKADGSPDNRATESTMSNMVADMFFDKLGKGNPEFIGLQNPGGTRADFDAGSVTYKEAALVLPFANTLMTTQITGAQFKTVLEQQWQRDASSNVPSRPYLQLGVSKNVTYTFDETRAEGDRITGIWVNGKPIDPAKSYTVGSGSFLISGGDNFHELAKGTNTVDSGLVDLTAWTEWIGEKSPVCPDFDKRAVSVTEVPATIEGPGTSYPVTIGAPGTLAKETVDLASTDAPKNATLTAYVVQGTTRVQVGTVAVTNGVATGEIAISDNTGLKPGAAVLEFTSAETKTVVRVAITLKVPAPTKASGVFGDHDGDMVADLYGVDNDGALWLYSGSITGPVANGQKVGAGFDNVTYMAQMPDFNNDGRSDMLVRRTDGSLWVYADNGSGGLTPLRQVGRNWNGMDVITPVGNIMGGTTQYVVARRQSDGALFAYTVTPSGLALKAQIGKNWGGMRTIFAAGDTNGDQIADVQAIREDGTLWLYRGQRSGVLGSAQQTGRGWGSFTTAFIAGDMSGDITYDMVGQREDGYVFLYTSLGGGWSFPRQIMTPAQTADLRLLA